MKPECIVCGRTCEDTEKVSEFYIGRYGSESEGRFTGIEFEIAYTLCPKHGMMVKDYIEGMRIYNRQIREI